jgi:hypothetical protein
LLPPNVAVDDEQKPDSADDLVLQSQNTPFADGRKQCQTCSNLLADLQAKSLELDQLTQKVGKLTYKLEMANQKYSILTTQYH